MERSASPMPVSARTMTWAASAKSTTTVGVDEVLEVLGHDGAQACLDLRPGPRTASRRRQDDPGELFHIEMHRGDSWGAVQFTPTRFSNVPRQSATVTAMTWTSHSDVISGPYLVDRDERAIRRVGSPRGVGCGFQWTAVRGFL